MQGGANKGRNNRKLKFPLWRLRKAGVQQEVTNRFHLWQFLSSSDKIFTRNNYSAQPGLENNPPRTINSSWTFNTELLFYVQMMNHWPTSPEPRALCFRMWKWKCMHISSCSGCLPGCTVPCIHNSHWSAKSLTPTLRQASHPCQWSRSWRLVSHQLPESQKEKFGVFRIRVGERCRARSYSALDQTCGRFCWWKIK